MPILVGFLRITRAVDKVLKSNDQLASDVAFDVLMRLEELGFKNCRYVTRGAITWIISAKSGKKLSGGYHYHYVGEDGGVYGALGARKELVVSPGGILARRGGVDGKRKKERDAESLILRKLGAGWSIEKSGALKYLCNDGQRTNRGHHELFWKGGCVWGILGAKKNLVYLPRN